MIDFKEMNVQDKYLSLCEAGMLTNPPTAAGTVGRWTRLGVGGVFLNVTKIGGRVFVTEKDVREFLRKTGRAAPTPAAISRSTKFQQITT